MAKSENQKQPSDYISAHKGAERRFYGAAPTIEFRDGESEDDPQLGVIRGIAARVNDPTTIRDYWGEYEEVILPGAFDDVYRTDNVVCLFNHNPNFVLARSKAGEGTLNLSITPQGDLAFEYTTPDITYARDLEKNVELGNISECSFAFRVDDAGQEWDKRADAPDKLPLRQLKKFTRLMDVSLVTMPAYHNTEVAKRSFDAAFADDDKQDEPSGSTLEAVQRQIIINKNFSDEI